MNRTVDGAFTDGRVWMQHSIDFRRHTDKVKHVPEEHLHDSLFQGHWHL